MDSENVPYSTNFTAHVGEAEYVIDGVTRVLADNANPFTFRGTGTYIVDVGQGRCVVVDPGPRRVAHLDALETALAGRELLAILITHTHGDHSPAAAELQRRCGGVTLGAGPHPLTAPQVESWHARNSSAFAELLALAVGSGQSKNSGFLAPGVELDEVGDYEFAPDHVVADGDEFTYGDVTFSTLLTPGHISNHACFVFGRHPRVVFSGDHIMGWSTSIIPPPDGDMSAYLTSLRAVDRVQSDLIIPTHGGVVDRPGPYIAALLAHRAQREAQIRDALAVGPRRIVELVPQMYGGLNPLLYPAAGQSVLAQLIDLCRRGVVEVSAESDEASEPLLGSTYRLVH